MAYLFFRPAHAPPTAAPTTFFCPEGLEAPLLPEGAAPFLAFAGWLALGGFALLLCAAGLTVRVKRLEEAKLAADSECEHRSTTCWIN